MEKLVLKSQKKDSSETAKVLRRSKIVPGVVYGQKQAAINIKLDASEVLKSFRVAGENRVVSLDVDGKKIDVLYHEVQKSPVTDEIIHVDFYAITAGEKIHTNIPLVFVGVSKAKVEESAIIEEVLKSLEVKCYVNDLIEKIEVDLGKLEKVWDNIKVSDLGLSDKYEILSSLDEVVAIAAKSREEVVDTTAPEASLPVDPKAETTAE